MIAFSILALSFFLGMYLLILAAGTIAGMLLITGIITDYLFGEPLPQF